MKKIYDIIPGKDINDSEIKDEIFKLIKSVKFEEWRNISNEFFSIDYFLEDNLYYILYLDPIGIVDRLTSCTGKEVILFLSDRIDFECSDGIDIAVYNRETKNVIVLIKNY